MLKQTVPLGLKGLAVVMVMVNGELGNEAPLYKYAGSGRTLVGTVFHFKRYFNLLRSCHF
jgi:hypothetical protein